MNDELLQTKIRIPPVQSRVMDRPHLKSRLDDALKSRLVMVSAPAGFGKTTLLANWAAGAPNPPAWLSLDSDDNDSHVFWKYFVAALSGAYPGTGVSAMKTLQSPSGIPVKAVVKTLINEIFQKRETVSIVLDDFHLIESGSVLELFKFFIDYMPENVRLVISTRTDLSFSAGRLRAEGQFDTITGEELRFTAGEAAEFAARVAGSGLDRTVVDRIFHRCEGWPAGLQMAFIAAEKYGGGSLFPRVKEHIIDYFMEEVFSCQPGHIRNFLLETSVLSRLNPSLCNAVTERSDSAEILDQLRAANLFLVELDGNSFWHRYHQIFAEALYARLAAEEPDRIELLHARAAQWFKRNKMPAEAIHHAIAGRQWKSAVELVSKYAAIAILRGDFPTALRWIRALPENRVTENPFLCISYAWALFLTNLSKFTSIPYSTIEYLLGEAEKFLPGLKQAQGEQGPEYQAVTGYVDALRVHLAYCRNEPRQQVLSRGRQILEKFSSDNVLVRTNIFFTLALTYLDTGELDSCSSCLEEARSAAFIGGYCFQVIIADSFRAYLARMRGRLRTSEMIRKKGLQSVKQAFVDTNRISPEMLGYYDLHRAYFLFERNRLDQAAAAAGSAMESIRLLGETYTRVFGYEVMFYINLFRGSDSDLVLFPLEKLENLYVYCTMARPFAGALRIRYLLARFPESREAVDRAFALADQYGISLWEDLDSEQKPHPVPFEKRMRRVKQLNLIRLFMEDIVTGLRRRCQMTRKEIRQNIELLLEGIRHDGFGDMEIEALILLALALDAEGRQTEAADTLKQAICLADPEGYLRIFVNEGTRLATVLEKCIKSGICVDYALKILNIIRTEAGSDASDIQDPAFPADDKPLSRQEQTVLRLLSSGLTNQEIAENLCIAVTTVKTHNYNIFKKLKVTSRMAAAEKAKQMGLGK